MANKKKPKQRTIYYKRIAWLDSEHNLEKYCKEAFNYLETTLSRTFTYGEGEIQGLDTDESFLSGGMLFHIAEYVDKQPTSLVPEPSAVTSTKTTELKAPGKNNFLKGDIFGLICDNDLLLCTSGSRESVAEYFIKKILEETGYSDLISKFNITTVANIDKIKQIMKHGVSSIDLNASLYDASVRYEERMTVKENIFNNFANTFIGIFTNNNDSELREISEKENLSVKLKISYDQRSDGKIGQKRLKEVSKQLIEDSQGDEFTIVTGNKQTFTHDKIRIHKKCFLIPHGNSVTKNSAWLELEKYYNELKEDGTLQL